MRYLSETYSNKTYKDKKPRIVSISNGYRIVATNRPYGWTRNGLKDNEFKTIKF